MRPEGEVQPELPPVEHGVRLLGLRFVHPATERAYRRWRVHASTPFARIGYIGSTPSWILLLVAVVALDHRAARQAAGWIVGWIVLLVVLTALTLPLRLRRSVMPLAAAANGAAGFLIVWLLSDVVLLNASHAARSGVMTVGLIVVMFFGFAIFRVPPGAAMAAITPYTAYGSLQLLDSYRDDELSGIEAGALGASQWIAYLGCLLVCLVIEIVDRRAFCKDQIIEAQQHELRKSRETIRRYVPRAVSDHIVRGDVVGIDVPVRREVTVLIADLVGFTGLAERVDAELLTLVTNDYMSTMSQTVESHGGIVNEFAGDGLMALFGAPDPMDPRDQAVNAVHAAETMQDLLPHLNRLWRESGVGDVMQMRIGISTGVLSVGSFGSRGRMTYTAIGLHTNIAARLEAACEPGGILLSSATWALAADRVPCEPRGEVPCKGVSEPVAAYAPVRAPATSAAPGTSTAPGVGAPHA